MPPSGEQNFKNPNLGNHWNKFKNFCILLRFLRSRKYLKMVEVMSVGYNH